MPPIVTGAAIVGGASLAGSIIGGIEQGNIASAQQQAAQQTQQEALGLAIPTAGELQTLNNQINLYQQQYTSATANLNQAEQELTSVYGPSVMAQGQSLFQSLQGQASPMATAYNQQRARSRDQLVQQLTSQLGPGALTSSVGQQALNNFDFQTNTNYAQINDQGINNEVNRLGALTGQQSSVFNTINQTYSGLRAGLAQIQGTQNAFQTRQIGALENTAPSVIGSAGSQYVEGANIGKGIAGAAQAAGTVYGLGMLESGSDSPSSFNTGSVSSDGTSPVGSIGGLNAPSQQAANFFNGTIPGQGYSPGTTNTKFGAIPAQ